MRIILAACFVVSFAAATAVAAEYTKDTPDQIKESIAKKKAVLVDVREKEEIDKGMIDGAISVPFSGLEKAGEDKDFLKVLGGALSVQIPKKAIVYTYCASGSRSMKAAKTFEALGYEVRPLKAGYRELLGTGFGRPPEGKPGEK